jgi:hypothetical protein
MSRQRKKVALVFGESDNDRSAIIELIKAINPNTGVISFQKRPKPLVLLRPAERPETRRKTADEIAGLVKAAEVVDEVCFVVTHRDCDKVEPAHTSLSNSIEKELATAGVSSVIAATPAFEIEAWWMLFPKEVHATRSCWAEIDYGSKNVGKIANAKERLRKDLRPKDPKIRQKCPDFSESDGVTIAKNIRLSGAATRPMTAQSASFEEFRAKVASLKI